MNSLNYYATAATAFLAMIAGLMAEPDPQPDQLIPERELVHGEEEQRANLPLRRLKGIEVYDDTIESILRNEETNTVLDKLKSPIVLKSMEDAYGHLTRASMEKIADMVNFEKQQVVIFAWQGSGQDRLTGYFNAGKIALAHVIYNPGYTKDVKTHIFIQALPKGIEMKVEKQEIQPVQINKNGGGW